MNLKELCELKKVKAAVKYGAPENPEFERSTPWTVTLSYGRRRMTVPFYTGPAITDEPTASDVLGCVCSDARTIEYSEGFDEWCNELGYEPDSRRAERIFQACKRISTRLHKFLGDDFDLFCDSEY